VDVLVVIVVLAAVVAMVAWPLRPGHATARDSAEAAERAELEAARDAKYREIRDAELDHRTGKLSAADWRPMDRALRAEAVAILQRLDALGDATDDPSRLP
jgi:type II secretory pathway pseudopilin PulG